MHILYYTTNVFFVLFFPFRCNNVLYIRGVEEEEEDGEMREWRVNRFLFLMGLEDLLVNLPFVLVLCKAVSFFFVKLLVWHFFTVRIIGGTKNKLCTFVCFCHFCLILKSTWNKIDPTYLMQQFISACNSEEKLLSLTLFWYYVMPHMVWYTPLSSWLQMYRISSHLNCFFFNIIEYVSLGNRH